MPSIFCSTTGRACMAERSCFSGVPGSSRWNTHYPSDFPAAAQHGTATPGFHGRAIPESSTRLAHVRSQVNSSARRRAF